MGGCRRRLSPAGLSSLLAAVGGSPTELRYGAAELLSVDEGAELEPAALGGCTRLARLAVCGAPVLGDAGLHAVTAGTPPPPPPPSSGSFQSALHCAPRRAARSRVSSARCVLAASPVLLRSAVPPPALSSSSAWTAASS